MKKIKLNTGLKLNKEAITKLQEEQLQTFKGGAMNEFSRNNGSINSCYYQTCNSNVL